jgi:hypothetical protein
MYNPLGQFAGAERMADEAGDEAALEADRVSFALNMPPNQPPLLLDEVAAETAVAVRACLVAGPL